MAIKSTIFKAELQITDMDRNYYHDHALTIARHPSENDARMMLRILAFVLHAHERLSFTKGLSSEDEPDLWQKSFSNEVELWIDLGQPDEKRIRRACGRANQVIIYTYNRTGADAWWHKMQTKLQRFSNLRIFNIDDATVTSLAGFSQRTMQLQFTIADGTTLLSNGEQSLEITPTITKL
ncbi:MAG: YaeQ family protein [Mariprofundus sp.]|nr:YaeQ family protein [Mariprofundus sp.]